MQPTKRTWAAFVAVVAIPPDTIRTFTLRARFIDGNVGSM